MKIVTFQNDPLELIEVTYLSKQTFYGTKFRIILKKCLYNIIKLFFLDVHTYGGLPNVSFCQDINDVSNIQPNNEKSFTNKIGQLKSQK